LGSPLALMELYEPAGVQVVVTEPQVGADGGEIRVSAGMARPTLTLQPGALELVRQVLEGKVSVLLGHSGVGKSTLVNALVPGAGRATGAVNDVTGRGRQTSTSVVALPLPAEAGWVIDTPGIRSLGIAHVQTEHVLAAFPELALVAEDECPRGCTHLPSAPDCALDEWVLGTDAGLGSVSGFGEVEAAGGVDPFGAAENSGGASLAVGVSLAGEAVSGRALRLASLRRLLEAREGAAAALALHASQVARRSV
jgi:ribosome biogenesis GTPase